MAYFFLALQMTGGVINIDGCTMESHGFLGNTLWCENFTFPLTHQKEARTTSRDIHTCSKTQMTRYTLCVCVCVCV